jgi:hypothetical protein
MQNMMNTRHTIIYPITMMADLLRHHKVRLSCESLREARTLKFYHGGHVANSGDNYYWYSIGYTPSAIFKDLPGDVIINQ